MPELKDWARSQISRLLPLDDDSINQLVSYSVTLPPEEAVEHLKTLLGDSPQVLEFISSFNARRGSQQSHKPKEPAVTRESEVPKAKQKKKKQVALNSLPEIRRPDNYGDTSGGYRKKEDDDYMPSSSRPKSKDGNGSGEHGPRLPSSSHRNEAFGGLLDPSLPNVHTRTSSPSRKTHSSNTSAASTPRTASPAKHTSTKVSITGGTPMQGASTTLADLDSAIRALELTTNPTINSPSADARRCSCMGSLHPLLTSAPNCLKCGKIICVKEGLAPCTFCGSPLLSSEQVQEMVQALREERGRERMAEHNAAHRRPEISTTPRPFSNSKPASTNNSRNASPATRNALEQAQAHRDRLLGFQASNAARTRVIDEAAAFETPDIGVSQWGSAVQRAAQLKRQQALFREMEWNARPDYEKRKMVVSVDIVGGKAVRKMVPVQRDKSDDSIQFDQTEEDTEEPTEDRVTARAGAFARNPLLGSLIRPIWHATEEQEPLGEPARHTESNGGTSATQSSRAWRRVQDDTNNEDVILDGGVYGRRQVQT